MHHSERAPIEKVARSLVAALVDCYRGGLFTFEQQQKEVNKSLECYDVSEMGNAVLINQLRCLSVDFVTQEVNG